MGAEIRPATQQLTIGGVARQAALWEIADPAGVVIARIAEHPVPIVREGVTFTPSSAFAGSNVSHESELAAGDFDLTAAIDIDGVTLRELKVALLEGGDVRRIIVDWEYPDAAAFDDTTYKIRGSEYDNTGIRIEAQTIEGEFDAVAGVEHNRSCRHDFGVFAGGKGCEADASSLTATTTVSVVIAGDVRAGFSTTTTATPPGFSEYAYGKVEFTTGKNAGFVSEVATHTNNGGGAHTITLQEPAPYAIEVGDELRITPGCPGSATACASYGQSLNFGGFPDVPGRDVLLEVS